MEKSHREREREDACYTPASLIPKSPLFSWRERADEFRGVDAKLTQPTLMIRDQYS